MGFGGEIETRNLILDPGPRSSPFAVCYLFLHLAHFPSRTHPLPTDVLVPGDYLSEKKDLDSLDSSDDVGNRERERKASTLSILFA